MCVTRVCDTCVRACVRASACECVRARVSADGHIGERAWSELGDLERLRKRVGQVLMHTSHLIIVIALYTVLNVQDGVTLDVAKVPAHVRSIVSDCFSYKAAQRPEFGAIVRRLAKVEDE